MKRKSIATEQSIFLLRCLVDKDSRHYQATYEITVYEKITKEELSVIKHIKRKKW